MVWDYDEDEEIHEDHKEMFGHDHVYRNSIVRCENKTLLQDPADMIMSASGGSNKTATEIRLFNRTILSPPQANEESVQSSGVKGSFSRQSQDRRKEELNSSLQRVRQSN